MQVSLVRSNQEEKAFLHLPKFLFPADRNRITPLDKDVTEVFDPKKNKAFRFGEAERWLLKDEKGKLIGRIAAFVNKKYKNKNDKVPAGGIGFFECIDDQSAADLLFKTAENWLALKGMQAMDGPINFGERDKWWGLVTEGFHPPMYGMNYNPPYYQALFENYGFKTFYEQICFGMKPKEPLNEKVMQRHAQISADPDFSSAHLEKDQLRKYAEDFTTVYNLAWAGHGGLKELKIDQVMLMFNKMKPVMNEKIIWFAYYKKQPVAIFVNLPDLNQWFKHLNGKFDLLAKLKFLLVKAVKKNNKFTGLVFGVVPEWQGKGVDAYIIGESHRKYIGTENSPYTEYEMQWIGDFNPKMINIAQGLGDVYRSRILRTYRYNFDGSAVERHPML